jgi:TP901 family phage tail tape measure protein
VATQFDATARINVDLRGFSQAANEVTRSGGSMTKIFQNLHTQLNQLEVVNKKVSADLIKMLSAFNQISSAAQKYASAVQALNKAETAKGPELMAKAFTQLQKVLSNVSGLSSREAERIGRTVTLYNQLASALQKVAKAYQTIRSVGQNDTKQALTAQRQAQATARLAIEQQRASVAAQREATAQQRLALEQQRVEAAAQRAANAQQRLNAEMNRTNTGMRNLGASSFAVRSSLGEIEQQGQGLLRVFEQIGQVLGASAISQEQAFAQVSRVVGEARAEAAGLLTAFQNIAASFPISFEEVARIAQLGAQIGISADELDQFTQTVARFALTTGVSAEQTTLLLGRIAEMQNVPISEMENLGSAILALGTASAATEEEILRINESISTVGNVFGLSAQAVTGLSSALATLRVRPELARGSLTRIFGVLDKTIQEGGVALGNLSREMDLAAEKVVDLRNSDPDQFFLRFIKGLQDSAQEAGGFQNVIRGMGINAVRDIDTLTRLGNNYNIVAESFARSNLEWSKGSELQRQSEGIFDTTAARLQNLADEFKNFAAQAGGPFAEAIAVAAKWASTLLQWLTKIGPIVPIVGTLAALVLVGAGAFVAYQVVLSKTIQSLIATAELQRNLGTSTLSLATAWRAYRGELSTTAVTTTEAAAANRALATSLAGVTTEAAAAAVAARANNVAQAQAVATSSAMIGQQAAISASLRQSAAAAALAANGMSAVSAANRAYAVTTAQAATSSRALATGIAAQGAAAATVNRAVGTLGVSTLTMSTAFQRAAQAGAAMGSGLQSANAALYSNQLIMSRTSGAALATTNSMNAMAVATQRAGLAARAASFAFGPWGIALAGIALVLTPLIGSMLDFSTNAEKIASSALKAAGGSEALRNAIKADTEEYQKTGQAFRTVNSAYDEASQKNRDLANAQLARAKAEKEAILSTAGSREELEKNASAQGSAAAGAQAYLDQLNRVDSVIKRTNKSIQDSTAAYGNQAKMFTTNAAQQVLLESGIADGSELSAKALKQLSDQGVSVGKILTKSFTNPKGATKDLDAAIADLNKTIDLGKAGGSLINTDYGGKLVDQGAAALQARDALQALRTVLEASSDEQLKASVIQQLLGDSITEAGRDSVVASAKIKLTSDNLEDLDTTAEDATAALDALAKTFMGFGTPLDAFTTAAKKAMGDSEKSVSKFSLQSRSNLRLFLKELDNIATAQQNWAANLVKISATLGPDITQGLANLGPEAAPMIQELSRLTTGELEKLKPRLAALGEGGAQELAAGLIKGLASLEGVSEKVRSTIATGLSSALKGAASPQAFSDIVNSYDDLIKRISEKKIDVDIAVNAAKAGVDIQKFLKSVDAAEKLKLKPEILFDKAKTVADFNSVMNIITTLASAKKAKISIDVDDAPVKLTLQQLEAWVKYQEISGLLDAKGKAAMEDSAFRAKVESLANLVLGKKAAGAFDVNGDGKFNDKEFRALFDALMKYIQGNKSKFSVDAVADLQDNVTPKVGGIIQALSSINGRTSTSYANVVQTTYRRQVDQGNRAGSGTIAAASGGYISGPGGPRDDKISAWLSDGEFVVNAAATRKHRALLEKINAHGARAASAQPYHFASGGMVRTERATATLMTQAAASMNRAANTLVNQVSRTADRKVQLPRTTMGPVITVNNTYPRDEPTSISINRSLAYAAALNGTL